MSKQFYLHGLNSCFMRKQNLRKYADYLTNVCNQTQTYRIEEADEIYIWTCAFRSDVKINSLEFIDKIKKNYPLKKIYICGCMPNIAPNECDQVKSTNVIIVPWKEENKVFTQNIAQYDNVYAEAPLCVDTTLFKKEHPDTPVAFCDQFIKVKISYGCTCDCTYCSEKLTFPSYHSWKIEDICSACEKYIIPDGKNDIMLLADSPGQYGIDLENNINITTLMDALYSLDCNVRIALNNLHPKFFIKFEDYLTQKIKEGKIAHINLPIQSASDHVLELMNRGYTSDDLEHIFIQFRLLKFEAFDTHIIIGFNGERKEDFEQTIQFLTRHQPRYVLASDFMETEVTKILDNKVCDEEKKHRADNLIAAMKKYGIIINHQSSSVGQDRLKRLSNIE